MPLLLHFIPSLETRLPSLGGGWASFDRAKPRPERSGKSHQCFGKAGQTLAVSESPHAPFDNPPHVSQ